MALESFQLRVLHPLASPSKTGAIPVKAALVTPEAAAAVEAAGYFNSAAVRLPKGSLIEAVMAVTGTPVTKRYVVTANDGAVVTVAVGT
jgi:hypothetical protein